VVKFQKEVMAMYPTLWRSSAVPSIWDELFSTRREFDRLFDRFFGQLALGQGAQVWMPVVDVRETADEIQVSAELPGIAPEDVSVTVENGVLTISGEKKQEVVEGKEDADYHLFERRYGRFERSFTLPRTVDAEKVKARFQNGVLHITLPKLQEAKPRRVQIEVGDGNRK
jgi:HSP20 family protein